MPIEGSHPLFRSTALCSQKGVIALRCEEGEEMHAYPDTRGILTIGVGHTLHAPSGVMFNANSVWSQETIDRVFALDLKPFVQAANDDLHVPVSQQQFDAIVSLEFNIGMAGLRKSHVIQVINAHGPAAVTEADFLAWAHPSELKGRRLREWAMYSKGIYRAA